MKRTVLIALSLLALTGCGQQPTAAPVLSGTKTANARPTMTDGIGAMAAAPGATGTASKAGSNAASLPAQSAGTEELGTVLPPAKTTTTTAPKATAAAGLKVAITDKHTERKLLVLKKLSVTVKVTNPSTEVLSGEVKIEYYSAPALLTKKVSLVETRTQVVQNLAPGQSVDVTLVSTKSAADAKVTVNTVVASSTAGVGGEDE